MGSWLGVGVWGFVGVGVCGWMCGCRVWICVYGCMLVQAGLGFKVQGLGFRDQGLGFRVQGVTGVGFRIQLRFRV